MTFISVSNNFKGLTQTYRVSCLTFKRFSSTVLYFEALMEILLVTLIDCLCNLSCYCSLHVVLHSNILTYKHAWCRYSSRLVLNIAGRKNTRRNRHGELIRRKTAGDRRFTPSTHRRAKQHLSLCYPNVWERSSYSKSISENDWNTRVKVLSLLCFWISAALTHLTASPAMFSALKLRFSSWSKTFKLLIWPKKEGKFSQPIKELFFFLSFSLSEKYSL